MPAIWGDIKAGELISALNGMHVSGPTETVFTGFNTDSRKIESGQVFLALKGDKYNGHDFIETAIKKGASGVIAEKGYENLRNNSVTLIIVEDTLKALGDLAGWWRHQHNPEVIAITGSAGKTTAKEMTFKILELGAMTLKNPGNLNNLIGLPLTLLTLEQKHHRAVVEMGMNHPGEIARLTEIADPDIGLITNVAKAHLEGVKNITGVAKAKTELIQEMSPDKIVILNGDDQLLIKTASHFNREVTTYGLGSKNHIRAVNIKDMGKEGISFELLYQGYSTPAFIKVPGRQNLYNALAASAIALCMREPIENIVEGLLNFEGIKGRFMINTLKNDIVLIDDTYNSNPYSLKAAIKSAMELASGNRRTVIALGEMLELGKETVSAHYEAGEMVAEAGASHLFALGTHAKEMVNGAIAGGLSPEKASIVNSLKEMEMKIRNTLQKRDLILLKGSRMMELEKVSMGLMKHLAKEA